MSLDRVDLRTTTGSTTVVTSSALPAGASTSAKQDDIKTAIESVSTGIADSYTNINRGSGDSNLVVDIEQIQLLRDILTQLLILNMHMSDWSGHEIKPQDIIQ